MNQIHKISVAKDFSTEPIGRFVEDGPKSGEVFRRDILLPAMAKHDRIEVNLDGTEGYGSSFLEEAFGGILRVTDLLIADVKRRLSFISTEEPLLLEEISGYLDRAGDAKKYLLPRNRG